MSTPTRDEIERVVAYLTTDESSERARRVVEDELVEWRDAMRFVIRRNGLVIYNADGSSSSIIRFGFEIGWRIALNDAVRAIPVGAVLVTARDDGLAEHRSYVPYYGNGWVACSCGLGEDDSEFDYNAHLVSVLASLPDDRLAEAEAKARRVEALCADPWTARNEGELARYQQGVARRGALAYGEFVKVSDLRAALSGGDAT